MKRPGQWQEVGYDFYSTGQSMILTNESEPISKVKLDTVWFLQRSFRRHNGHRVLAFKSEVRKDFGQSSETEKRHSG